MRINIRIKQDANKEHTNEFEDKLVKLCEEYKNIVKQPTEDCYFTTYE